MDDFVVGNFTSNMTQLFVNMSNNETNMTHPCYKAPVMQPITVVLCLVLALLCVIIYGGTALKLRFMQSFERGVDNNEFLSCTRQQCIT